MKKQVEAGTVPFFGSTTWACQGNWNSLHLASSWFQGQHCLFFATSTEAIKLNRLTWLQHFTPYYPHSYSKSATCLFPYKFNYSTASYSSYASNQLYTVSGPKERPEWPAPLHPLCCLQPPVVSFAKRLRTSAPVKNAGIDQTAV